MSAIVPELYSAFIDFLLGLGLNQEEMEWCLEHPELARVHVERFKDSLVVAVAKSSPIWRPVEGRPSAIDVNLGADPKLPFADAGIAWHWGRRTGWVRVELCGDTLYIDARPVDFHLDSKQKSGISGLKLREILFREVADVVLHPNIKTALMENKHLLPQSWRRDRHGTRCISFWAVGFRDLTDRPYVEYIFWEKNTWREGLSRLHVHCHFYHQAVYVVPERAPLPGPSLTLI